MFQVLRLEQTAVNNTAAGKITNLISNDVERFDMVSLYLNYIWITPIQVIFEYLKLSDLSDIMSRNEPAL